MSDLTALTDVAARAWFDHQQAGRLDSGRNNPLTGRRWTWDDLTPDDQRAYRALVEPIAAAIGAWLDEQEDA